MSSVLLNDEEGFLVISNKNAAVGVKYPYVWLRDNCHCHVCWHHNGGARILSLDQLDIHIKPGNVDVSNYFD